MTDIKLADEPPVEKISVKAEEEDSFPNKKSVRSVEHMREDARFYIAILIISPVLCIVILGFLSLFFGKYTDLKDLIESLLTPIIGLVGAVTGFYFSESRSGKDDT